MNIRIELEFDAAYVISNFPQGNTHIQIDRLDIREREKNTHQIESDRRLTYNQNIQLHLKKIRKIGRFFSRSTYLICEINKTRKKRS